MNLYSIGYKTKDDFIVRETVVKANNKKEALENLYKELGEEFDYDSVALEERNIERKDYIEY